MFSANALAPAINMRLPGSLLLTRFRGSMYRPLFQNFRFRNLRSQNGRKTGSNDTFMIMGSNLAMQVVRTYRVDRAGHKPSAAFFTNLFELFMVSIGQPSLHQ
jgi:hypothetical protein